MQPVGAVHVVKPPEKVVVRDIQNRYALLTVVALLIPILQMASAGSASERRLLVNHKVFLCFDSHFLSTLAVLPDHMVPCANDAGRVRETGTPVHAAEPAGPSIQGCCRCFQSS